MAEITTQELLDRIFSADSDELNAVISAVEERFRTVWPNWDILVLTSEGRKPEDQIKILQRSIHILSKFAKNDLP